MEKQNRNDQPRKRKWLAPLLLAGALVATGWYFRSGLSNWFRSLLPNNQPQIEGENRQDLRTYKTAEAVNAALLALKTPTGEAARCYVTTQTPIESSSFETEPGLNVRQIDGSDQIVGISELNGIVEPDSLLGEFLQWSRYRGTKLVASEDVPVLETWSPYRIIGQQVPEPVRDLRIMWKDEVGYIGQVVQRQPFLDDPYSGDSGLAQLNIACQFADPDIFAFTFPEIVHAHALNLNSPESGQTATVNGEPFKP